jgi:hypothetical protein
VTATEALSRAAAAGPYFALDLDASGPGWVPLRLLIDDAAAVTERVDFVRAALALRCRLPVEEIDARASASIHLLGLASRLIAPALGAVAIAGLVPAFGVDDLLWQRTEGGPVPIGVRAGAVDVEVADGIAVPGPPDAAAGLLDGVVRPVVAPVLDAFAGAASVSAIVLWGNVASALAGAAAMLKRSGVVLAVDPVGIVTSLLALPGPLHAAGRFDDYGRFFVRASCCLFYRIPSAGKCGDCVLL